MAKTIQQITKFENVSPEELFDIYMDSKKHADMTGGKVSVSKKAGGKFLAFNGEILGKNLLVVPKLMIVQAWRAKFWKKNDPDSILILTFGKASRGARIHLVHVNVPDYDYRGVNQGWNKYYWKLWKTYLKMRSKNG